MNAILSKVIEESSPKFNEYITNGMGQEVLKQLPDYLDSIFRYSINSLNPGVPLSYLGYRRMTPENEFNSLIVKNNRAHFDLAISDIVPIEFVFNFDGKELSKPVYLPFCRKGSLFKITDTIYNIVPVLSDTVISPKIDGIFLRLLKDKINFKRTDYNILLNGRKYIGLIICAPTLVKCKRNINITDKFVNPGGLYILGQYGLKEAFDKYMVKANKINSGKDKPYIVTNLEDVSAYTDKYNVYESTNMYRHNDSVVKNTVKILVHKSAVESDWLNNIITAIIYAFDNYPERLDDYLQIDNVKDEIYFWRILLARIEFNNQYSVAKNHTEMTNLFNGLQYYVEPLIKSKLEENGVHINDFFELFSYIMENFNKLVLEYKEYNSDIENRYIDILYYISYNIILGFNRSIIKINQLYNKKNGRELTYNQILHTLTMNFKTKEVFALTKSSEQNIAVQLTEATSDIIYPKITAVLEDQSRGIGVTKGGGKAKPGKGKPKGKSKAMPDAIKFIRGHDLFLGSLLFLTKKAPSPRLRVNPYIKFDTNSGKLTMPKDIKVTTDLINSLLKGKTELTNIDILESE